MRLQCGAEPFGQEMPVDWLSFESPGPVGCEFLGNGIRVGGISSVDCLDRPDGGAGARCKAFEVSKHIVLTDCSLVIIESQSYCLEIHSI